MTADTEQIDWPVDLDLGDGKLHRTDGPAVEYAGGSREWWQAGVFVLDGVRAR